MNGRGEFDQQEKDKECDFDFLRFRAQAFKHFGDNEEVMARVKQQAFPSVPPSSGFYQLRQSGGADSPARPNDEADVHTKIADILIALRASERARREGQNETDAMRRYLAEVEVAAAGLVSRIQELEHLLTLSTANQENWDVKQLRGQMLMITTRDARQQAVAASQAVSVARQATMELDKVKREASALTTSQAEEIRILRLEAAHYLALSEKNQYQDLEAALIASHHETAALRRTIDDMKKDVEEKAAQIHDLSRTLELSKATVRAAERQLQEAQVEKKDISVQNELLQSEVADLQSREVQATIAHYDHELCKVRAVLEGEKAHLLTELARYRRGNQNLRGELAECQGKYNAILSQSNGPLQVVSSGYEPTAFASSKLREFFSIDLMDTPVQTGVYVTSDQTERRTSNFSALVPVAVDTSSPERVLESRERELCKLESREGEGALICSSKGKHNAKAMSREERIELQDGLLISSSRSYPDEQLGTSVERENGAGEACLTERWDNVDGVARLPRRKLGDGELHKLEKTRKEEIRSHHKDCGSPDSLETSTSSQRRGEGTCKTAKKMRSVACLAPAPSRDDPIIICTEGSTEGKCLEIVDNTEENCLETRENLLAAAHWEICKLKQINQELVAACQ